MNSLFRIVISGLVLLFLWQAILIMWQLPDYFLPSPLQVFDVMWQQLPLLLNETKPSLLEIALGFIFGVLFGCLVGLSLAFFRFIATWLLPILIISQALPTFAIAPLLVLWLGYGLSSKIAIAILMIFFPVASAFYDGLRSTPCAWLDLAKTMQASKWKIFWHIKIPAALPKLAAGIRIAAVIAPIGAIVGEWVGSSQGLGYLMLNANARLQIDMMFAALVVIICIALILYFLVDKCLQKLIWWD